MVSSVSKAVSVSVVRISLGLGLRLSISRPLAVSKVSVSKVSESSVSESSVSTKSAVNMGIGLSLGESHSGQGSNKNGFNHLGLFLHLVLGGESPCTLPCSHC